MIFIIQLILYEMALFSQFQFHFIIHVGLTKNEFYKISITKEVPLDAFTISLYTLADKLGLHVIDKQAVFQPVFAKKEMFCKSLNQIIPEGNLIGSTAKT